MQYEPSTLGSLNGPAMRLTIAALSWKPGRSSQPATAQAAAITQLSV